MVCVLLHSELVNGSGAEVLDGRRMHTTQMAIQDQHFATSELVRESIKLRAIPEVRPHFVQMSAHGMSGHLTIPRTDWDIPGDHAHSGGLAGPVHAQKTETFALGHADTQTPDSVERLLLLHREGLVQIIDDQGLSVLVALRLTGHVGILRVVTGEVGYLRIPAKQQPEGLVEPLVLDQHVDCEHDGSHHHQSQEQLTSVVIVESIGRFAHSEFIANSVRKVRGGDDNQPAAQAVVGQHPRAHHAQDVIPDLQIWDFILVQFQCRHCQRRHGAGEDVQADEHHVGVGGHAEALAHSVHRRGHRCTVQNEEHQGRRRARQSESLDGKDLKQASTHEGGNQEIDHIPHIG
mmetsp:Transcript_9575/g.22851  ORF Transcript_9575/g.22851 Transcript_9575/m.22851 type:complete len:348 (+) Transcript_9575:692-1735(+)